MERFSVIRQRAPRLKLLYFLRNYQVSLTVMAVKACAGTTNTNREIGKERKEEQIFWKILKYDNCMDADLIIIVILFI